MNDQSQLLMRSIKGPVIMITVGVLFAADKFTSYRFHETWPVLLIVIGLVQLLGGRRPRAGYYPPPVPPAASVDPRVYPTTVQYPPATPSAAPQDSEEPRL